MEDRKTSFVLHLDMLEDIKEMTESEKSGFLDFVVNYNLGLINLDDVEAGATKRYYRLFANQFDRDHAKWMNTKEKRREAGKKGGLAKASKPSNCHDIVAFASDAKHKGNVKVKVNVKDNVKVNKKQIVEKPDYQLRAEGLFNRKESRPMDKAEKSAWESAKDIVGLTTDEEWNCLEKFYAAPQSETYARKAYATLLNNFTGEVSRAKEWWGVESKKHAPLTPKHIIYK